MPWNVTEWAALREEDLVDMAITGSREAFGELSRRHRDKLHAHLYFRTNSDDDADDLTQEVFCKAWAAIGRFKRTDSPFVAWLLTIARNLLVDRARSGKAYREFSSVRLRSPDWEGVTMEMDATLPLPDTDRWTDPEAVCLLREEAARVRRALAAIKPDQRFVIGGRWLGCLDFADLADAMAKTEGNVRVIHHRGLRALYRALTGEERPSLWGAAS